MLSMPGKNFSHFCKQRGPRSDCSDLGPHCLPVCKNRFEKFARIFSRRHKQTTFSDAGFLGVLRVKNEFKLEKYVECISNDKSQSALAAFHLSAHSLEIERGRYINVPRE